MSEETSNTGEAEGDAGGEAGGSDGGGASGGEVDAGGEAAGAAAKERVDADGLPLDRDPTIDDVRSQEARHGRIAFGCTAVIVLLIVLFWLIRGGIIG